MIRTFKRKYPESYKTVNFVLHFFAAMMMVVGFTAMLLLTSCSPAKRLEHILKKHPELMVKKDTTVLDTTIIKTVGIDTSIKTPVFIDRLLHDTVVIHKDKFTERIYTVHDTVKVDVVLPGDTIVKKIPIEKVVYKECENAGYGNLFLAFFFGFFVFAILAFLALRRKR